MSHRWLARARLGSVNLSMDGVWTVTFEVTRGGDLLGCIAYDLGVL